MHFVSQTSLSDRLLRGLDELWDTSAVIVPLTDETLLTSLMMARQLRAWVYPLLYVTIYEPGTSQLMGALAADGNYVALASDSAQASDESITQPTKKQLRAATKKLAATLASCDLTLDETQLNGRNVVLVAGHLDSMLPVQLAQRLLMHSNPKTISVAVARTSPDIAAALRLLTSEVTISTISNGVSAIHHDEPQTETYTTQEQFEITRNIAAYWQ